MVRRAVAVDLRERGHCAVHGIRRDVALSDAPAKCRAEPVPGFPRGGWLHVPYRPETRQHVARRDPVHRLVPDRRGVQPERRVPFPGERRAGFPTIRRVARDRLFGGFAKRRDAAAARVHTLADGPRVLNGLVPGFRQRDFGKPAEPGRRQPPRDAQPLPPCAREPVALHPVNAQAQAARAASVAVNAGLAHRPNERGSKGCRSPCHRILPCRGALYSILFKGEYTGCPGTARDEPAQLT